MTAIADHDVIDDRDPDQRAGFAQATRELDVIVARRGVTRRMIVREHASRRGHAHERPKHLARMHGDIGDGAAPHLDDIEDAIANIDADHDDLCWSPAIRGASNR